MESITFECEVITPMFLAGADGSTPELRAPSIKGALRFWWRAMNGHLELKDFKDRRTGRVKKGLRTIEGRIFGSAEHGRSKVIIKILNPVDLEIDYINRLPHRVGTGKNPSPDRSIQIGVKFKVILSVVNSVFIDKEKLKNLFEIVALTGGIGKRTRRGMGSFKITQIDNTEYKTPSLEQLLEKFKRITPYYSLQNKAIKNIYQGRTAYYPWIRQIEFGRTYENIENLLVQVGETSSDLKDKNHRKYEGSLGHAFKGRFASPIYVSVSQNDSGYFPIITSLNTVPDYHHKNDVDLVLQEKFKREVL